MLAIHDAQGRRVRELVNELRSGGEHEVKWDMRDGAGHGVANGLYLVLLKADGRTHARRLPVLR